MGVMSYLGSTLIPFSHLLNDYVFQSIETISNIKDACGAR